MTSRKQRRQQLPRGHDILAQSLKGIATVLLRLGIDAPRAEKLLRAAFVHAAAEIPRFKTTAPNQSRIATISGVNRVDVRKILLANSKSPVPRAYTNRVERVITAWRSDPQFHDRHGRPRPLTYKGRASEFAKLVKKYGRDVTTKSLLEQLFRTGAISESAGQIAVTRKTEKSSPEVIAAREDLKFMHSQLRVLQLSLGRRAYVSRSVAIRVINQKAARRVQKAITRKLEVVLRGLDAMSQREARADNAKTHRVIVTANVAAESGKQFDEC